ARESYGQKVANSVSWLFVLWFITGAPAVTVIAASYLAYAIPMSREMIYAVAASLIIGAFFINYQGIRLSGRVQMIVVGAITVLLITAVAASIPSIKLSNFTPFFPGDFTTIGVAAALIFWSFLGYENVSNVAQEFKNPERDFHRSIALSAILIGILYISVAIATIGTHSYKEGGSVAPFAAILSNAIGSYAALGTAILAVIIIFGTVNAYSAGMSRVVYAAAGDGGLPRWFDRVNPKTGVPHRSLILLQGGSVVSLLFYYVLNFDLATALLIPSGAAILVYIVGSASGIRLLKGRGRRERVFPWISLIISLIMAPFVGLLLIASLVVAGAGLVFKRNGPLSARAVESLVPASEKTAST
ncbi:MAG TPA: amino acid permease, partial [Candidatus Binatus sp.]|nr:amino acid permease [Candidatus Binatus sp.]